MPGGSAPPSPPEGRASGSGAGLAGSRADRAVVLAVVLYVAALVASLLASGARLTQEDGFYYLRIAERLAAGEGSSFDGLGRTNGYHPLWLLLLVPVFRLAGSPEAGVLGAVLLQGALLAVGAALLYAAARFDVGRLAASLAALLWLGLVWSLALAGLEFALHTGLLLAVVWLYRRRFWPDTPLSSGTWVALGLLLGAVFLARLDSLLLAGTLVASLAWRERRRPVPVALAHLAALAGTVGVIGLVYAAVNQGLFGLMVPVSSLVKQSWSQVLLSEDPRYLQGGFWAAKAHHLLVPLLDPRGWPTRALLLGSLGTALAWRWLPPLRPYGPFVVFSLAQVLGYGLSLHGLHSFTRWYYAIQPILTALLAAAVVDALAAWAGATAGDRRPLVRVVALATWCAIPVATLRSAGRLLEEGRGAPDGPLYVAARWARENLPADARIGTWNAGAIGFLSRRRVVNLDGLVNSREYFERERHDLCAYWDKVGLTHLLDVFQPGAGLRVAGRPVPPASYRACADRLELLWQADPPAESGRAQAFRIRPRSAAAGALPRGFHASAESPPQQQRAVR